MAYPYRHPSEVLVLSNYFGDPEARTLKGWEARRLRSAPQGAGDVAGRDRE